MEIVRQLARCSLFVEKAHVVCNLPRDRGANEMLLIAVTGSVNPFMLPFSSWSLWLIALNPPFFVFKNIFNLQVYSFKREAI